ncbi:hypothetical protein Tco_0751356 [Tanacetum coccineum]|uniref:Uncharacterized protein n=1 Tax=Tanacetum coccineum TaxID=301880 RepID=A0ABQ4Z4T5_9ASTR
MYNDNKSLIRLSADVERAHGGDGVGDDRPHPYCTHGCGGCLGTEFDLASRHGESDRWPQIYAGIQQHLQRFQWQKGCSSKKRYWVLRGGTYDWSSLRRRRFPRTFLRTSVLENTVCDPHLPSWTHTVGGFLEPPRTSRYIVLLRLQGLAQNTPSGVPYTEDEIKAIVRGGKQWGHILGVGRVLPRQGTVIPLPSQSTHSADIARLKKREKRLTKQVNMFMRREDECGDDEPGDDENGGEDEEDEDDS